MCWRVVPTGRVVLFLLETTPLATVFAEFAKGVLAGIAFWWLGKKNIVLLAARMLVGIKSYIVTLDILRLSISAGWPMTSFTLSTRSVRSPCFKVVSFILSTEPLWNCVY